MMSDLDASGVLRALAGLRFGHPVYVYGRLGSTNDEARRLAAAGAPEGLLVLAETQTAGRGRQGRRWITPRGAALAFSLVLRPALTPAEASRVTMLAGLAACEAVEQAAGVPAALKWPNDVLLDGRKAGGILVESGLTEAGLAYLVLGIGLNVSAAPPPAAVMFPATSVEAAAGRPVDRLALLQALVQRLSAGYADLAPGNDRLHTAWAGRLAWRGQRVVAHTPEGDYHGCFEGADPDGALRLKHEDGRTKRVLAGDVSIRRS